VRRFTRDQFASLAPAGCHRCHEPGFRVVDADQTLRQFADLYLLETTTQVYFAASDGRYRGMVSIDQLEGVGKSKLT